MTGQTKMFIDEHKKILWTNDFQTYFHELMLFQNKHRGT